jgi:hypothetical protein
MAEVSERRAATPDLNNNHNMHISTALFISRSESHGELTATESDSLESSTVGDGLAAAVDLLLLVIPKPPPKKDEIIPETLQKLNHKYSIPLIFPEPQRTPAKLSLSGGIWSIAPSRRGG